MNDEIMSVFNERAELLSVEIAELRKEGRGFVGCDKEWDKAAARLVLSNVLSKGLCRDQYLGLWRWLHVIEDKAESAAKSGGGLPKSLTLELDPNGVFVLAEVLSVALREVGMRAAISRAAAMKDPGQMEYWAPPKREAKPL